MVSQNFYNKRNLVSKFLEGKIPHFLGKEPSVTLEWYSYAIKNGETLYTISERIFGKGLDHLWTYIADNNTPKFPDDWAVGDIIRLPKIIIRDSDTVKTTYSDAATSTTGIQD